MQGVDGATQIEHATIGPSHSPNARRINMRYTAQTRQGQREYELRKQSYRSHLFALAFEIEPNKFPDQIVAWNPRRPFLVTS
jgi:hypothetical protein